MIEHPKLHEHYTHHKDPSTTYLVTGFGFCTERQCLTVKYEPLGGPKRAHLDEVGAGEYQRRLDGGTDGWMLPLDDGTPRFLKVASWTPSSSSPSPAS